MSEAFPAVALILCALPAVAQVDQHLATTYFKEAAVLCELEGGKLWGVSLCGPLVFADPATHTITSNQAAPDTKPRAVMGFANMAMEWGGTRWSMIAWPMIVPMDEHARALLMLHELFHRIQPQLGFSPEEGRNEHLDTTDGRYLIQLEWRALAKALAASGPERISALQDALAFRFARRKVFPAAAENERRLEINEGLAQYTATASSATSVAGAVADGIEQLKRAERNQTFVRTFPYPSGAAYGLLLDAWSPGWTRRVKATDDLAQLLIRATGLRPAGDAVAAANRYGGGELRVAEEKRDAENQVRVAEMRRRFVEGPVLTIPAARTAAFTTNGMTPIPDAGTVYPNFRGSDDWGSLEGDSVLKAESGQLIVPGPFKVDGATVTGDGWTLRAASGWAVGPGGRAGDLELVKAETPRQKVIRIVARIQRADYEGDRAALKNLPGELEQFIEDKDLSSRVLYWRGFALWRRAMNGFNDSVDPTELEQDLTLAVGEFQKAAAQDSGFVDAKVGAGSCLSIALGLVSKDPARVRELIAKAGPLLKEAQAAEPDNPRLLWVLGPNLWWAPPERGGGQGKSIDAYEKGLAAVRRRKGNPSDPLEPSWGEPELLMSLAWSHLNRREPDLRSAEQYAQQALALVPYWHYVRDILLPQIQEAKRNAF